MDAIKTCYGCGKIGHSGHSIGINTPATLSKVILFGQERYICCKSRKQKISCIMDAIKKLWQNRTCPACGETNKSYNDKKRMILCTECELYLEHGRKHYNKPEIETEIIAETIIDLAKGITFYDDYIQELDALENYNRVKKRILKMQTKKIIKLAKKINSF